MTGIFLSYRRGPGASEAAGRLHDRLASRFGEDRVFMDVDTVRPGMDFVEAIGTAIDSSSAVLAIIDPKWAVDDNGRNRIAEPEDYVRLEVATALERGVTVIPVLVLGAQMPTRDELPPDLEPLARRQAVVLTHERFTTDVIPLERELNDLSATPKPAKAAPAAAPQQPKQQQPKQQQRRRGRGVLWVVVVLILAGGVAVAIALWPRPEPSPGPSSAAEVHVEPRPQEDGSVVVYATNVGDADANGQVFCGMDPVADVFLSPGESRDVHRFEPDTDVPECRFEPAGDG